LDDAVSALGKALDSAPKRADFYEQGTGFLVAKGRASEALSWINKAARMLPESREILLMKATTLEFANHADEAEHLLNEIQNRWPEWSAVWEAHGMILDHHSRFEEARQALETAVALGARNSVTYFYLADAALHSGADRRDAAEMAIRQALKLSPRDPWILTLAGRIALARGEKSVAVERWRAAIRERPQSIEAHSGLAEAYEALGKKQEAQAELQNVRSSAGAKQGPPYLDRLFQAGRPTPR
jgi:Flp pilus assembly protein TadD